MQISAFHIHISRSLELMTQAVNITIWKHILEEVLLFCYGKQQSSLCTVKPAAKQRNGLRMCPQFSYPFAIRQQEVHSRYRSWWPFFMQITYLRAKPLRSWENGRKPHRYHVPSEWRYEDHHQSWQYFLGPNEERRSDPKSPDWKDADFSHLCWRWEILQKMKKKMDETQFF